MHEIICIDKGANRNDVQRITLIIIVFSDLLDRIVYGKTTDNDYIRRYNILDRQEQERFHNAIYIYIYILPTMK